MKKKVAFLINSLSPGGAERVVSVLLNHLKSSLFDIELILLEDEITFSIPSEIKVTKLSAYTSEGSAIRKTLQIPLFAYRLARYVNDEKIDLVISFLYRADFVNILSSRLTGAGVVVSERVHASSTYRDGSTASRLYRFLIRTLYPRADLVINVSEGTKRDLVDNFQIDPQKQIVIYNPYQIETIAEAFREEIAFDFAREDTLVVVAWLRKVKNIGMILEVFAMLDRSKQLIIVGSGEEEHSLRQKAQELGVAQRVHFVGADTNPWKYLSKAALYISASRSEGFPNAMVEAMLCRCTVVVSDAPSGPREILAPDSDPVAYMKEGVEVTPYGILYPVDDKAMLAKALHFCFENPLEREAIAERGYARASMFDVKRICQRYTDTIKTLLSI